VLSLADARLHGGARPVGAAHPWRVNLSESQVGCASSLALAPTRELD
jgi:hypothetical protein